MSVPREDIQVIFLPVLQGPLREWLEGKGLHLIEIASRSSELPTYVVGLGDPRPGSFTCPRCHTTSHHEADIANGYCGNCHAFTLVLSS